MVLQLFIEKKALTEVEGLTLTYGQIESASGLISASLSQLGVQRGDRGSVEVAKSTQALALYLGCLRDGANVDYPAGKLTAKRSRLTQRLFLLSNIL